MAGSGVNVKMGVTGVAQFKQSISQARQNMKTLDAQLALTEKQYKATGDAEEYMQQKSQQLQSKLDEQKRVAEAAEKALQQMTENGVEKSNKAYQEMLRTLAQAKGDMIDTQTAIDNIGGAAADADTDVTSLNDSLKDIDKGVSVQNVTEALAKITSGMEAAMKKAWELGKAITREVLGAGSWADDLATRAAYYGISPEELQRMEKTADLIDTSVESIIGAKRKMNKALGAGGEGTVDALEALGLSNIVSTNPEDQFWEIGKAIMAMGDAYTQEEAAQKLFGKSWHELVPLFEAGREEYEKLNKSWNVVPQEQIDALAEMDDKYQVLKNDLETVKLTFLGELAPAATKVMETLTGLVGKFNEYIQSEKGQEMMDSLGRAVESLFDDLTKVDPEKTMQDIIGIFDRIRDGLEWIANNKETVVGAVEAFISAWAVLKTAQGVSTALQLINGIQGLAGGSAAAGAAQAGAATGASWGSAFAAAVMKAAPWLAGIYTLLNPSDTGNDDLWDQEGNPTELGRSLGINQTQSEFENNNEPYTPQWLESSGMVEEPKDQTEAIERNMRRLRAHHALEDLQEYGTTNPGTPTGWLTTVVTDIKKSVSEAVTSAMTSMGVYMDGQKVGEMVEGYVNEALAGMVLSQ